MRRCVRSPAHPTSDRQVLIIVLPLVAVVRVVVVVLLVAGSYDKTVKLFNVNDGAVLRTFKHHTHWVFSLALLPDGLRFVSGSSDKTACIAYHGLAA